MFWSILFIFSKTKNNMSNINFSILYTLLLLEITWKSSTTTELMYYFHEYDLSITNTTDMSKITGKDIRELYIDLTYNTYIQKVTVELTSGLSHLDF